MEEARYIAEELIVVFNHNIMNLHFTANKNTMYVYELLR